MRALTVAPSVANLARVEHIPEPPLSAGMVPVRGLALRICATDREILSGVHGVTQVGGVGSVKWVPDNESVFGRVNARAAQWTQALAPERHDVKVVADFS